ncbi:nuclear transport factor 2 family protein [Streptomyces sp. VNUA24]|uniref:nuclear transport factor 2 family protein n=1 Tax=Streptomyces sp. VNUA24 TaxID=3031131 RepID=UPI0023B7E2FF|nr:nuclear transport factor 2 family protein [Streptomyces sp. VNUA24]WEH12863.1 ester cyclase [Streptomyces sp. VNUA24]
MNRKTTLVAGLAAATLTLGGTAFATQGSTSAHHHGKAAKAKSTTERNKRTALAFIDLAFNKKKPQRAADRYIGATYTQHNPNFADGKAAFVSAVTDYTKQFPQLNEDVKRVSAEGDLVYVHTHETTTPTDLGSAVVDIFRFKDGKIVEHWDVTQAVPETSANDNTMF